MVREKKSVWRFRGTKGAVRAQTRAVAPSQHHPPRGGVGTLFSSTRTHIIGPQDTLFTISDPLPFHWYFFFGILEPISVLAEAYYAIALPERYHYELIPHAFLPPAQVQSLLNDSSVLADNARMALGQLGSCYSLIMLNSALLFYAFRKHLSKQPILLERLVYYLIAVLGIADWSHIFLTLYLLPNGPPSSRALLLTSRATWQDKLMLLAKPASWNSLLFGNIIITFILFCFRVMWCIGIARGSPIAEQKMAERKTKTV